jgi:hypothetical protein
LERVIRLVIGIGALSFYGAIAPPWHYLTLLGFVPIATALVGYCPLYHLLHIRERPAPR